MVYIRSTFGLHPVIGGATESRPKVAPDGRQFAQRHGATIASATNMPRASIYQNKKRTYRKVNRQVKEINSIVMTSSYSSTDGVGPKNRAYRPNEVRLELLCVRLR